VIPGVGAERLMTDNAFAYRYSLRELCSAAEIEQVFIRPALPMAERLVERLNGTLLTEWVYRQVFLTNDERSAAPLRPASRTATLSRHTALGGLPPVSRLLPT
jgi:transposase InsO family protein